MPNWDYSWPGYYFITICTKNRENFFGKIFQMKMQLSAIGEIVSREWENTRNLRSGIEIDEWIVMPNHLHGIIIINKNQNRAATKCRDALKCVSAFGRFADGTRPYKNKFGPQSNNISAIIRGFKGAATKKIHVAKFKEFAWQPRFYDHIIFDDRGLETIRRYIRNNVLNWENDRNNSKNFGDC